MLLLVPPLTLCESKMHQALKIKNAYSFLVVGVFYFILGDTKNLLSRFEREEENRLIALLLRFELGAKRF
jgi:hypothetical protein